MTTVKEALKIITKSGDEIYSIVGIVKIIDEAERTCVVSPINGDADLLDVRLQASLNGENGWCVFPAKGSEVLVTFLNKNAGYVALCSETEKLIYKNANTELMADAGGFSIKRGTENLKAIIADLCDAIIKITVPTGVGPSGVPINAPEITAVKTRLNNLLK